MLDKEKFTINELNIAARRGLVVWVYNLRQLKTLKKFGTVVYASRKMKYVILYVNDANINETIQGINKLHFVRSVDVSKRPDVDVSGDLNSILADIETTDEDFIYNGKQVTPLMNNK